MTMDDRSSFDPEVDRIFIPSIPEDVLSFTRDVWYAFVNKVVSLTSVDDHLLFEHSVFEAIRDDHLKIVVSSSQAAMRDLVPGGSKDKFNQFIARTRPIRLDDRRNVSARFLRRAIMAHAREGHLPVDRLSLPDRTVLHPDLQVLLTPSMKYAAMVPVFVKDIPIGVLWGIHEEPFGDEHWEQAQWQLRNVAEGIDTIVSQELDSGRDGYSTRRAIEKIQADSQITSIILTRQAKGRRPVKSLYAHSYLFKKDYRMDTAYVVPSADGFAVSIKYYRPRETNDTGLNLLLIPGFFCSRSAMDRLAREMALHYGYKVFTLNVRGRSKRTLPKGRKLFGSWTIDDYIWEDFPAALRWIQRRCPDQQTVVVGHSMGGMIPLFYAGAYHLAAGAFDKVDLVDPREQLAGIVSIAAPSYINLDESVSGVGLTNKFTDLYSQSLFNKALKAVVAKAAPSSIRTIDLNRFFKVLNGLGTPSQTMSFKLGHRLPTVKDFVGYDQITPPEWYFMMEDVFCEESLSVVFQFIRAQFGDNAFTSFDGKVNYTHTMGNITLPIYSFYGSEDTIAPPESVLGGHEMVESANRRETVVPQGHLGIIMHPPTVRDIGALADEWIQAL